MGYLTVLSWTDKSYFSRAADAILSPLNFAINGSDRSRFYTVLNPNPTQDKPDLSYRKSPPAPYKGALREASLRVAAVAFSTLISPLCAVAFIYRQVNTEYKKQLNCFHADEAVKAFYAKTITDKKELEAAKSLVIKSLSPDLPVHAGKKLRENFDKEYRIVDALVKAKQDVKLFEAKAKTPSDFFEGLEDLEKAKKALEALIVDEFSQNAKNSLQARINVANDEAQERMYDQAKSTFYSLVRDEKLSWFSNQSFKNWMLNPLTDAREKQIELEEFEKLLKYEILASPNFKEDTLEVKDDLKKNYEAFMQATNLPKVQADSAWGRGLPAPPGIGRKANRKSGVFGTWRRKHTKNNKQRSAEG